MDSNLEPTPKPTPPVVPTAEQIQQRYTELLGDPAAPGSPQSGQNPSQPNHPQPRTTPPRQTQPTPTQSAQPRPATPLTLRPPALHGLAGDVVRLLAPHTEAPPAAILLQLLAAFGNALGPDPHCLVDATRHGLNLFVVLVGESSKSRKGTSWNQIAQLFAEVDRPWLTHRVTNDRLTAGVLNQILRDQPGATDRRHLVLSEEFASVLHYMGSSRGQLSPLLRCAWDHGQLTTLASPSLAGSRAHLSLIAHITERELAATLHRTDAHNGFANRCLWAPVRRSQCLPEGGTLRPHELTPIAARLRGALDWAEGASPFFFQRSERARELWRQYYAELSQARPGLYGAATSRAEAQVLRLSALYAALDSSRFIEPNHLHAALALWDYCAAGAAQLFGLATGDPTADRILEALHSQPAGLTKTRINALFRGNLAVDRLDAALDYLEGLGIVYAETLFGNGRPALVWHAIPHRENPESQADEEEGFADEQDGDQLEEDDPAVG
jgi:hypothetical protein